MGSLSLLQGIFPTQELNRVSGFIALQVDSLPTELSEHNLSKIPVKSEFNWIHNWKNFLYSYTIKYQMICLTWSGNIMIHRHCILWIRLAFVFTINEPQKQFLRGSRPVFTGSTMSNECARWCSIMNNGATNTKQEELGGFSCHIGGTSGKESVCQCRRLERCRFDPWVGKIPWRWKWQPTPVLLPGESHGQKSLAGNGPQGHKESDTTEWLHTHVPW